MNNTLYRTVTKLINNQNKKFVREIPFNDIITFIGSNTLLLETKQRGFNTIHILSKENNSYIIYDNKRYDYSNIAELHSVLNDKYVNKLLDNI